MSAAMAIAQIAIEIPDPPTSGDLLRALTQAEQSGFERGYIQAQSPGELIFGGEP